MTNFPLFDTHAHLQDEKFSNELDSIIENARANGVRGIFNVGTCIKSSKEVISIADKYPECYALVGIHPHDASGFNDDSIPTLTELTNHPKVLGIGEIGLDYHYDFSPRDIQKKAFIAQWELAAKLNLPAIIHVREAFEDFFSYIKDLKKPAKVLLHCFSGNIEDTKKAIELGFHFSIGGPLTFPKAELTREVFKIIPLDKIHLETDCPYLAPKPKRGKRNEPAFVKYTFEYMANLFNISEQTLSEQLADNANNFFNISLNK